jgi:hypothetical protein
MTPTTLSGNAPIIVAGRITVTKTAAAILTAAEVLSGLVLLAASAQLTLPEAAQGNAGADLYVSAAAGGALYCAAGFHGNGTNCDTLTLAGGEGCHVYSDGDAWYLLGCGPGCVLS